MYQLPERRQNARVYPPPNFQVPFVWKDKHGRLGVVRGYVTTYFLSKQTEPINLCTRVHMCAPAIRASRRKRHTGVVLSFRVLASSDEHGRIHDYGRIK